MYIKFSNGSLICWLTWKSNYKTDGYIGKYIFQWMCYTKYKANFVHIIMNDSRHIQDKRLKKTCNREKIWKIICHKNMYNIHNCIKISQWCLSTAAKDHIINVINNICCTVIRITYILYYIYVFVSIFYNVFVKMMWKLRLKCQRQKRAFHSYNNHFL